MLRLTDIALPFDHTPESLPAAIANRLNIPESRLLRFTIARKSIDARKKFSILAVYTIDADIENESEILSTCTNDPKTAPTPSLAYKMPDLRRKSRSAPVIVGSGPAGLFAALLLAQFGLKPIVLERGKTVLSRVKDVNAFWRSGRLDPESNVQFGEGGAGTFSDGKLTTQIKDKSNRIRKVLEEFVAAGAPEEVLYSARPHIGTDNLRSIVTNLRKTIISLGGTVRFQTKLTSLKIKNGKIAAAIVNDSEAIETDTLVLALGHSARDTFEMLHTLGVPLEPKPFSIGVRIEHPQSLIDKAQYGKFAGHKLLPPAEYKLVAHCPNGRSAYTFCMCPGGQVIASSSEPNSVVTNGMSLYSRNRPNANSALLVPVTPQDFPSSHPLSGIEFQRHWERKAFTLAGANYFAPIQLLSDFLNNVPSTSLGSITPSYTPGTTPTNLTHCLPDFVTETLRLSIPQLNNKLPGFSTPDAILTALESRSSSPLRILRDPQTLQSPNIKGLYPTGEGSGYAGGIMSSATDALKTAETIASNP